MFHQGYSRDLHLSADFAGLDNNDRVGDARRADEAMVVAITPAYTCVCFFRSVPGPKRPSFISLVMSEQANSYEKWFRIFAQGVKWIFCLTSGTIQARDVDLFVIGGGSGGVRAARVASGHGARLMLAEEYRPGRDVCRPRLRAEEAVSTRAVSATRSTRPRNSAGACR
jgi:hypothetical protein